MKRLAFLITLIVATGSVFLLPTQSSAQEPAQEFLDALRAQNYHDIAIEYLNRIESTDMITDEFRNVLPFEKAQTLIDSTPRLRDINKIESRLDEAQKLLTDYASKNKSLEVSARTYRFQGNLLFRRSVIYVNQSKSERATASEREEAFVKARGVLAESMKSYQNARDQIKRLLDPKSPDAIRINPDDPSTGKRRSQFENTFTQVRVRLPMVTEQLADTFPEGNAQRKKLLQAAAEDYYDVWSDYNRYLAGFRACVYAARCEQKLGQHQKALDLLANIFELGNNAVLKPLKLEAYTLASTSWSQMDPYPFNEVVQRLEPAVKVLNRVEARKPEWLRVKMELAMAQYRMGENIKAEGGPKSSSQSKAIIRDAAKMLRDVTRVPSPYRDQAKEILGSWNVNLAMKGDEAEKAPETFSDAKQKSKDLVGELELTLSEVNAMRSKVASTSDAAQKAKLSEELATLETQLNEQASSTIEMLNFAMTLTDDATLRADINNLRYLQSYCYFATQKYFESALIGDFLLQKYPMVEGTEQAMMLLIKSYSILLDRAEGDDKSFEKKRLSNTCVNVVKRWPGSVVAGAASGTMTRLSLIEGDLAEAEKYYQGIPTDSPMKSSLGCSIGRRLWRDYRVKLKQPGANEQQLQDQLERTQKYLSQSVASQSVDTMSLDIARGAQSLVEVYLTKGNVEQAVKTLEGDVGGNSIAPLDLVKQKHPVVNSSQSFRGETYRIAIKTYLAAMKQASGPQLNTWINKSSGVIASMRQLAEATKNPTDQKRVTASYQLIAQSLNEKFVLLKTAGEKKEFARTLSSFFGAIEKDSTDAGTVLWAGSTLLSVANSLTASELKEDATPIFAQAVSAIDRAEKMGFQGNPKDARNLKRQRALAQRGSGNYDEAIRLFVEILTENSKDWVMQMDAAETLQMAAKAANRPAGFIEAIKGRMVDVPRSKKKKKLIWGWQAIVTATQKSKSQQDIYYRALYHFVESKVEVGIIQKNSKYLRQSLGEIKKARSKSPTFSGKPEWKAKFDELEARIKSNM
ncbi:MAG: hypothetical protein AB8B55_16995 [Mariniblastus sp.]